MVPFRGMWTSGYLAPGAALPPEVERFDSGSNTVGPGYFRAMGIPILAGRKFGEADGPGAPRAVVLNEAAAAQLWPGQSAIGKTMFHQGDEPLTVMGVARTATYYRLDEEATPQVYLPVLQAYQPRVLFLLRAAGEPGALAPAALRVLRDVDPRLAFAQVRPLEDICEQPLARYRTSASLVGLFAVLALAFAAVGLYGVLSYLVVRRSREIGVCMALGATRRRVARSVLGRALSLAAMGIALGLGLAVAAGQLVASFLYGVEARDPWTFALAPLVLLAAAFVATWLPARRARRTDPMTSLRAE